jgi:hypothetical protein
MMTPENCFGTSLANPDRTCAANRKRDMAQNRLIGYEVVPIVRKSSR